MRLFYYQRGDRQPNFGDELNPWLWPQLRPDLFGQDAQDESATVFVGTGTLLNNKLPARVGPDSRLIVFSTGAGYEQPLQQIPDSWQICCVRGPLSAQRLGLPPEKAITDGGLLIAKVFAPPAAQQGCSFMPHIHSASPAAESWQRICQQADVRYIDPRWPIEQVLQAIGSSQRVLAEAMHGAIAADALRVPWIPVITTPRIYSFKWQDWCASMNLPYRPHRLPPLADYPRWGRGLRSGWVAAQHWAGATVENALATAQYGLFADPTAIARRLSDIAKKRPYLSTDETFKARLDSLQSCLDQVS
ncbi:MAG: polysaccharide pyruvyl transferase family protein [Phormidesmis sp.]